MNFGKYDSNQSTNDIHVEILYLVNVYKSLKYKNSNIQTFAK